jgi:hypothetical protein
MQNVECLLTLSDILVDAESELHEVVFNDVTQHLKNLKYMFLKYFPP